LAATSIANIQPIRCRVERPAVRPVMILVIGTSPASDEDGGLPRTTGTRADRTP
jgi:hypothetical protein